MKDFFFLLCFLGIARVSLAQNTFPSSGNVGIGTISPGAKLDIYNGDVQLTEQSNIARTITMQRSGSEIGALSTFNTRLTLGAAPGYDAMIQNSSNAGLIVKDATGNVGIGITSPQNIMHVNGASDGYGYLRITDGTIGSTASDGVRIGYNSGSFRIQNYENSPISFFTNTSTEAVTIIANGNVGIGTTDPQGYKLAVNGNMIATSVKVKLHADWPDYVFHKNYSLKPLYEVEKYIKVNNHLPDIPSAYEIQVGGLDLGEMNAKLLKKIEELTLYIIDQNKRIEKLEEEIN